MTQFLLIAAATFASEDLTCISTGALIASGKIGWTPGVLACLAGIYVGDLLLYFAGRMIGRPVLGRYIAGPKLDRASQWLTQRGAGVVVLSRFTPGLRLPTYVAAGLLKTRFWWFSFYFLMAAVLWTPALVGAAALLGKRLPQVGIAGPVLMLILLQARRIMPGWETRRRAVGWIRRKTRWEFWPPSIAYLPVVPYIIYLAIRHRSLTLFTVANPGIPAAGFAGESKSEILSRLTSVPEWTIGTSPETVYEFMNKHRLPYPIVLKPDVGERGSGVVIARGPEDVAGYFERPVPKTIVQKYVGGVEFGVFYYRYPGDHEGRIFSITEKRFPAVAGDGASTIRELVLRDERAVCLADLYLSRLNRPADDVPEAGTSVRLAELGSHCRGAVFLNGARLETAALRDAIDAIARQFPGFYFGRFDVKSQSTAALQRGEFQILELNGVTAEATHIYDPSVTLPEAYRVLLRQWKIAFEIGAANRSRGRQPMPVRDFVRLIRTHRAGVRQASAGSVRPPLGAMFWFSRKRFSGS